MNIDTIITQVRKFAPVFENRVYGAAELVRAKQEGFDRFPAAYVVFAGDAADDNGQLNGVTQYVDETLHIMVALDNRGDRRGQGAAVTVEQVRAALFGAILNWKPDPKRMPKGFGYVGSDLEEMSTAALWHRFTFKRAILIGHEDGFNVWGEEITDFKIDPADPVTGVKLPGRP